MKLHIVGAPHLTSTKLPTTQIRLESPYAKSCRRDELQYLHFFLFRRNFRSTLSQADENSVTKKYPLLPSVTGGFSLCILLHKLLVKLDNAPHPLRPRRQKRSPEMQRPLLLPKSTPGHDANARSLQQPHAVKLVRRPALRGGRLGRLGRQLDGREEVHAPLRLSALDALHLAKGLVQGGGAFLEAVEDARELLVVELVRGVAGLGRVDHELDEALADDRGAERDGDELVDLGLDLGVEAYELKVAAAMAALAYHALGDGVQGCELDVVVRTGRLGLHAAKDGLEGVELADEDVGLVDLVGHDDQFLLLGVLDDGADVFFGKGRASRVSGVDDDNGAGVDAVRLRLFVCFFDGGEVGAPGFGLVEEVGHAGCVQDREGGGVEGVLRDGDEYSGGLVSADDVEKGVHAG